MNVYGDNAATGIVMQIDLPGFAHDAHRCIDPEPAFRVAGKDGDRDCARRNCHHQIVPAGAFGLNGRVTTDHGAMAAVKRGKQVPGDAACFHLLKQARCLDGNVFGVGHFEYLVRLVCRVRHQLGNGNTFGNALAGNCADTVL